MRRRALALSWLALVASCGGAKPAAPEVAKSDGPAKPDVNEIPDAPDGPPKPSCDDGSCTLCGDGVCPHGFYCETSKKGNTACAWVPSCVEKPTCACLAPFVKGCACEDANGAAHVTCK